MTVFSGHTENAGHFLQVATMAIGHNVIALLLKQLFEQWVERGVTHAPSLSARRDEDANKFDPSRMGRYSFGRNYGGGLPIGCFIGSARFDGKRRISEKGIKILVKPATSVNSISPNSRFF